MFAGVEREVIRSLSIEENRIPSRFQSFDLQLAVLINHFHVLPRNPVVPRRGPDRRLATDDLLHARLHSPPPAVLGLSALSDQIRHIAKESSRRGFPPRLDGRHGMQGR